MAAIIPWDQAVATPSASPEGGKVAPRGNIVPWDAATGKVQFEEDAKRLQTFGGAVADIAGNVARRGLEAVGLRAVAGTAPKLGRVEAEDKLLGMEAEGKTPAETVRRGAATQVGTLAQGMDMFTGVLGGLYRLPAFMVGNTLATAKGESPAVSAKVGAQFAEALPEAIAAPFGKIASALGQEEAYQNNPAGWMNEKIMEVLQKGASKTHRETGLPEEWFMQAADAAMSLVGYKATTSALRRGMDARELAKLGDSVKLAEGKIAEAASGEATRLGPLEKAKAAETVETPPPTAREGEMIVMETRKQVKALFDAAKADKMVPDAAAVSRIFEDAKRPAAGKAVLDSQQRIAAAAHERLIGEGLGEIPKGRLSDTPIVGEEPKPLTSLDSALAKIRKHGENAGFQMTAAEKIALRAMGQEVKILDKDGKFIRGASNAEVLGTLAAVTGISLLAAPLVWQTFFKEDTRRPDQDLTPRQRLPDTPPWRQFTPPRRDHEIVVDAGLGAAITGMVLGRKGWPHPRLVESLADALFDGAAPRRDLTNTAAHTQVVNWTERAVSRWLQKGDNPVADVEIPFGEGTAKLGEVINKAFRSSEAKYFSDLAGTKIPLDEPVFDLAGTPRMLGGQGGHAGAGNALKSYLSHVGDYLRQNVPPEKLGQYDLPRAIRETDAADARAKAAMEKAAAATTKELPVVREYPDGMRWVELRKPDKLTAEQAKSVRKLEVDTDVIKEPYYAVDAAGKPIRNSYTDRIARGNTPEETYLAGRLAEEGNQMGHCVGGYCEEVASGESRIFSLRDAKGRSHVTVEVQPPFDPFKLMDPAQRNRPTDTPEQPDILQIKGKQNRAPNAEYLPYVQDFVRNPPEGKAWGEVGDLGNTGLEPARGIYEPFNKLAEELFPGKQYLTKEELTKLNEVDRARLNASRERGSADPRLLAKVAAVGGGAVLGAVVGGEDKRTHGTVLGAAFGALLASKGGRAMLGDAAKTADYVGGEISTRMRNISEPLMRRARSFEEQSMTQTHEAIKRVDPFLVTLNKLPDDIKKPLNRALLSNDAAEIQRLLLRAGPEAAREWAEVKAVLAETGKKLESGEWLSRLREDYFPRIVTDAEGLLEVLGKELRTRLDTELLKAEKQSMKVQGRPLSDLEKSLIINKALRASPSTSGREGFQRSRGIDEVTAELEPFYAPPTESLHSYLRSANFEIEKARFFGRDLAKQKHGNVSYVDTDASIGNVVRREYEAGKITREQMKEVASMLHSRFGPGEQGARGWIQDARSIANLGLLGNVVSAATQLGDAAMSVFHADLRGTLGAMAQKIRGTQQIRAADYGLVDHLSEEFVSQRKAAKALNTAFRWSGFQGIDLFGKDTVLNAALNRFQRLAQTEGGQARLIKEHGAAFEGDMAPLIQDLRDGKMTPLVKELLFNKLSDAQPITKMEVPQAYLDMPNGRVIYMLKTFMLKQIDVARVKGYNEIAKGNVAVGMKNLLEYATLLGVAGAGTDMVKDWLLGRPLDAKWKDVPLNALKTFGWSEYTLNMLAAGKPLKAVGNIVAPPYQMLDDLIRGDPKSWNYLPLVGKLIYPRTDAGELSEARRAMKQRQADDPVYQEKREMLRKRAQERLKDPAWREYYLRRARGENPTRPGR